MKLCILHCGHPKTGTSSLQRYLAANADKLAENGILYPSVRRSADRGPAMPWAGFQNGAPLKLLARRNENLRKLDQLTHLTQTTPHDVLLLSAEVLMQLLFYRAKSAIWEYLIAQGYQIETISYLRDQPERLNSAYAQQCKTAAYTKDFDTFCKGHSTNSDEDEPNADDEDDDAGRMFFDVLVAEGQHGWGHHNFRPFSSEVKKLGVEADFMIGLREILARHNLAPGLTEEAVAGFGQPERRNESDGVLLVAVGRTIGDYIARTYNVQQKVRPLSRAVFRAGTAAIAALGIDDPKFNALTKDRVLALRAVFKPTNDVVAQKIWGKLWEEVFPLPDGTNLTSTDLDEADDPNLRAQYDQILARVSEAIKPAEAEFRGLSADEQHAKKKRRVL